MPDAWVNTPRGSRAPSRRNHGSRLTFWRELTGSPSPHTRVILARAECDYRAPAHFGDELEVRLNVGEIGRSSFALVYEIASTADGRTIATGKTVIVSYDYEAAKAVLLPPETRALLEGVRPQSAAKPRPG